MKRPAGKQAVTFEKVNKTFDTVVAVDNVDLGIVDGEFFAMLGPSGSGKTTCLRMIAGFELPTSGRILLLDPDRAEFLASEAPHGGFKQSGFGKDLSEEAVLDYTITKHVMVKHA